MSVIARLIRIVFARSLINCVAAVLSGNCSGRTCRVAIALSLLATLCELLYPAGDHFSAGERSRLCPAEDRREDLANCGLSEDQTDSNEQCAPRGKAADRCEETRNTAACDPSNDAASTGEEDLNDRQECRKRSDGKECAEGITSRLLTAAFVPDTECNQRGWKHPAASPEPRSKNVTQCVSKESAPREDQPNRKHDSSHCKRQEDERTCRCAADHSAAAGSSAASVPCHVRPRRRPAPRVVVASSLGSRI